MRRKKKKEVKEMVKISKNVSRNLLLRNLKEENKKNNVYLTFKFMINKEKIREFKENNGSE